MADAGKISVRLEWDGTEVRAATVSSSRPYAYWLLAGRSPQRVVQLVPMLFSICRKAQQAAADAAVAAAQGRELSAAAQLERLVACEAMQEHLWRLLLDWPNALGLPQHQQQFARWHAALGEIAAGQGDAERLCGELQRVLLGVDDGAWRGIDSHAALNDWWNAGDGLLAALLAALDHRERQLEFSGLSAVCDWLPEWSAAEALQAFAGHLDREFAARPVYHGRPLETGALVHCRKLPLLRDVLRKRPTRLLARLVARLVDLLDSADALAQQNTLGRVQGVGGMDGAGLSMVRTARGMLLHHVRIEAEQVADYLIAAPTEWNFHPHGALASGLVGLQERDAVRLAETAGCYVLSLDPCVEYEIEVADA